MTLFQLGREALVSGRPHLPPPAGTGCLAYCHGECCGYARILSIFTQRELVENQLDKGTDMADESQKAAAFSEQCQTTSYSAYRCYDLGRAAVSMV